MCNLILILHARVYNNFRRCNCLLEFYRSLIEVSLTDCCNNFFLKYFFSR